MEPIIVRINLDLGNLWPHSPSWAWDTAFFPSLDSDYGFLWARYTEYDDDGLSSIQVNINFARKLNFLDFIKREPWTVADLPLLIDDHAGTCRQSFSRRG